MPTSDAPRSRPRPGLLQPGGALHPGVSWTRFAVAGVVGFVFLVCIAVLVLQVPESRPWGYSVSAFALGMQWRRRRLQRNRPAEQAPRD